MLFFIISISMSQHNKKSIEQNTVVRESLPPSKKNRFVVEELGGALAHDRDRGAFYERVKTIFPDLERYATRGQIVSISKYWQKLMDNANMNRKEEMLCGQLRQLVIAKQQTMLHKNIDIPDKQ